MVTNNVTRRGLMAGGMALGLCAGLPALALTQNQAQLLISKLVGEIHGIINSGKTEKTMLRQFEGVFARYADAERIARGTLGAAARSTSAAQLSQYSTAFRGYMARKYGRRFREFIGAEITVTGTKSHPRRGFLVSSVVKFPGQAPFGVEWWVVETGGRPLMLDLKIEGISMLVLEREEIASMLDRRGGDVGKLIKDLKKR